ncbi:MAG: hypothetical protein WCK04_02415 [Actinomycetes bacterium]
MVFLRKHITKHNVGFACTTQTFHGDVWQEAQAAIDVEERWGLLADASAIAQAERSRMRLTDGLMNTRTPIVASCVGGSVVTGLILEVGIDVIIVQENNATVAAVSLQSLLRIQGVTRVLRLEAHAASVTAPLTMAGWLRSRTRENLHFNMIDSWTINGRLQEVGADFVTLFGDDQGAVSLMTEHISVIRSNEICA